MLQTIETTAKKGANRSTKTQFIISVSHLTQKSVIVKTESALTIARRNVITEMTKEVRSISSYFREFRRTFKDIETYLNEAHKKGRTFNSQLIQDILMIGNIKPIIAADEKIQALKSASARAKGKKFTEPQLWSANRLFIAFIVAVETTPKRVK